MRGSTYEARLAIALAFGWALLISFGVMTISRDYEPAQTTPRNADPDHSVARGLAINYRMFDARGLVLSFGADSFAIVPRQFLIFGIRSINEARATNAKIRLNVRSDEGHNADPTSAGLDIANDLRFSPTADGSKSAYGVVTRGVIDRVSVKISGDAGLLMTLRAERAVLDRRHEGPRFLNAVLEDARSDRRISTREIVWDRKSKEFLIRGPYWAEASSKRASGYGARVDLDFRVTALSRGAQAIQHP